MKTLLLLVTIAGLTQAPAAPPLQAPGVPPPGTDIYLVAIPSGLASMKTARPSPVSVAAGYDNQPNFSPDGSRILFAGNRDGKQIDVYVFDRGANRVTQLTKTPENENSPTYLPAGAGPNGSFSVVQSEFDRNGGRPQSPIQRLWRFDATGKSELILPDINPVGYHVWMDNDQLVLFVLGAQGKPSMLQIASVKTGKAEVAAENIGRSLHRIPGTRLASFVHRAGETYTVKQIDPSTKSIEPLIDAVPGSSERDMAWMPDGNTILMSAGTKVFSWTRGATGWSEVFDAASHQLGAISRISVSPGGDAVAIVVAEPSTRK
jgi:hypothetical protein